MDCWKWTRSKIECSTGKIRNTYERHLYHGVWADKIKEGDLLPVAGSVAGDNFDKMLEIDTAWMDPRFSNFTPESMREYFDEGFEKRLIAADMYI